MAQWPGHGQSQRVIFTRLYTVIDLLMIYTPCRWVNFKLTLLVRNPLKTDRVLLLGSRSDCEPAPSLSSAIWPNYVIAGYRTRMRKHRPYQEAEAEVCRCRVILCAIYTIGFVQIKRESCHVTIDDTKSLCIVQCHTVTWYMHIKHTIDQNGTCNKITSHDMYK